MELFSSVDQVEVMNRTQYPESELDELEAVITDFKKIAELFYGDEKHAMIIMARLLLSVNNYYDFYHEVGDKTLKIVFKTWES